MMHRNQFLNFKTISNIILKKVTNSKKTVNHITMLNIQ